MGMLKTLSVWSAVLMLVGCGADVATTTATSAVIKKQAIDAGKQVKEMADKKIDEATQVIQQRAKQQENEEK